MYVIFPADEVVYLSYGRVIYIPPGSPPCESLNTPPARTSCSSGSHVSYPSLPSTSTNSSTRSRQSTKSWPIEPSRPEDRKENNSLSSLNESSSGNNSNAPPVRPRRKKEFSFKLPSLLSKSKPKTPVLERKLSFSDFETFAKEIREKSVDSVVNKSDYEYQTRRSRQEQVNGDHVVQASRPSILKSGKCVVNKTNRSPCLMIKETDVFNFERPSSSKTREEDVPGRSKQKSEVLVSSSKGAKPVRKISSEKQPQIKITSDKSPLRNQRETTPSTSSRGILTRSFSLKPNSSRFFGETSNFSASFDRDYREVTPPTNSCREKSPPGKTPSENKQSGKSLYNKPTKLLKKPLQLSKSFKEITTPPPVKTPTTPVPGKKSPSSKSLTVDFDSLFRRETSPAKVSLKNLAPKFEDDSSRLESESFDHFKECVPAFIVYPIIIFIQVNPAIPLHPEKLN